MITETDRHEAPHILLVEDHQDSAEVLQLILSLRGWSVTVANSVAQACDLGQAQPVDVVVSDMGLPDGSGLTLLAELRRLQERLHSRPLKAIALSGYGMDDDIRRSEAAGFACHLIKPLEDGQLEATIERLLGQR